MVWFAVDTRTPSRSVIPKGCSQDQRTQQVTMYVTALCASRAGQLHPHGCKTLGLGSLHAYLTTKIILFWLTAPHDCSRHKRQTTHHHRNTQDNRCHTPEDRFISGMNEFHSRISPELALEWRTQPKLAALGRSHRDRSINASLGG